MTNGGLLFLAALFIAFGVGDANMGNYSISVFWFIIGIGIGINLIIKYIKELYHGK